MGATIRRFRGVFLTTAGFSLLANLLWVLPSIYFLQVFDRVLTSRSNETLWMLTLLTMVALWMAGVLDGMRGRLLSTTSVALEQQLSGKVLAIMLTDAAQPRPAIHPQHGLRDVAVLRGFLSGPGLTALFDLPWLPVYLLIIFLFHPVMGAVALAGSLILLGMAVLNERRLHRPLMAMAKVSRQSARDADLSLRNAEVATAMGMAPALARHWELRNESALKWQLRANRITNAYSALSKSARQVIQIIMLAIGALLVINLDASAGVMVAATILLGRALVPMESLIGAWRHLVDALAAYRRLDALLENNGSRMTRTELPAPKGELRVEQLVFGIKPDEPAILKGVSLHLGVGQSLAVIGPSASGKSTLARLLVGSWRPTLGTVRLDGADVSTWPRESIGAHLGYLPQDVELFAGTISENIARMGGVDAPAVMVAAQQAGVHDMILRLPQGIWPKIGKFSNPNDSTCGGSQRCGVPISDAARSADNASALNVQRWPVFGRRPWSIRRRLRSSPSPVCLRCTELRAPPPWSAAHLAPPAATGCINVRWPVASPASWYPVGSRMADRPYSHPEAAATPTSPPT